MEEEGHGMTQLALFEAVTVASPLCSYERKPCHKGGRAVYGQPEDLGGCVNREITCLTCSARGEESRRKP